METDENGQEWVGVADVAALVSKTGRKQTVWVMLTKAQRRRAEGTSRMFDLPLPERRVKRPVPRHALRPDGPCAHCDQPIHEDPDSGVLVHGNGAQTCPDGQTDAARKPYSPVAQWTPQWRRETIDAWWANRRDPVLRRQSQARPRDPETGRFLPQNAWERAS